MAPPVAKAKKEGMERFQAPGIDFKAKMIGIEKVNDARGDKMCQEAMTKLKAMVKSAGEHKQRVIINISLEGLKIIDEKMRSINHHHEVHKISFISRDPVDNRAFGYIYGESTNHQFFGIKTEKASENVVLALKDLFQAVLELKTKQMEEQKVSKVETTLYLKPSYDDPLYEVPMVQEKDVTASEAPPETSQTPEDVNALYAVPHKVAAPSSGRESLLDLENEVKMLQTGINDMDHFMMDPLQESSTTQVQSPDSTGTKSPNPFIAPNLWSNDSFEAPSTQSAPAESKPAADFGAAFGDPFTAPTKTKQSSSADLFAEFSDQFNTPSSAGAAPSTANPFGNNLFTSAFGGAPGGSALGGPGGGAFGGSASSSVSTTSGSAFGAPSGNAFGAPSGSAFGAPSSSAFGAPSSTTIGTSNTSIFGAPSSNSFQSNFAAPTQQAPPIPKFNDPFGDPFSIGDAINSHSVFGEPLAPSPAPTTKEKSPAKMDPFSGLAVLSSNSTTKSGKDMFAGFQMAKPGEVSIPDIMTAGIPDRPAPAVPSSGEDIIDSLTSPVDLAQNNEDFNLPPPQVPPPTLPPSFDAFGEHDAPPPPPPRPQHSFPNTASVPIPPRPARPSSSQNLDSNHSEDSSPPMNTITNQQCSLPCNWTSNSLEINIDKQNSETQSQKSHSDNNLVANVSSSIDNQTVFDPFNLHSHNITPAQSIPTQCTSNHSSNSHFNSFTPSTRRTPPFLNGINILSTSLPSNERMPLKLSNSKSTSSISSLQAKGATLPIHEDPFADDPFTSSLCASSLCASSSHSSQIVVPPPLPSRPKSQESVNNEKTPISGGSAAKPFLTTSDGLTLFDDSPFGL